MDETRFTVIAMEELATLAETLESTDKEGLLEIEFLDGILSIKLEDGREYVINKHTPTRKIWVSSPISGAGYYSYVEESGIWHSTKGADNNLRAMLYDELKVATGLVLEE